MSHENDLVREVTVHFKDGSVAVVNRFGMKENAIIQQLTDENAALKAEVERLRKAGDEMAQLVESEVKAHWNRNSKLKAWKAAKEGGAK